MSNNRLQERGKKNTEPTQALARGRKFAERRAWADAHKSLIRADAQMALEADDLELLAHSAYLIGREEDFLKTLDRAHSAHVAVGAMARAARCAFWLGLTLMFRGESGRGSGWLAGARRLIQHVDCVERGYLLLPKAEQCLGTKEFDAAQTLTAEAIEIGDRFDDADLVSCARHVEGRVLMARGQVEPGLTLLDEAMVPVTAGTLSPIMTGLIYCSVIDACQQVYAVARAREWTAALAHWCDAQPQMVAFTGTCLVHRAEIMQMRGAWRDAIEEAGRACARAAQGVDLHPPAAAYYRQAEVYRLQGDYKAAETAYRTASRLGLEPQPGLALMRLAQGRIDKAVVAIRRAIAANQDPLQRTALLSAGVEIMLKAGDVDDARGAGTELEEIAAQFDSTVLGAMAATARGAVEMASGETEAALGSLQTAFKAWQAVEAPYEAARVRVALGLACRKFGDEEGAEMELDAAKTVFDRLGAAPDLVSVAGLMKSGSPPRPGGLTERELQVLRLVAAGLTNKAVARELSLSEKTIDRHLSNIFNKLDVPSRVAATAYAYEQDLL